MRRLAALSPDALALLESLGATRFLSAAQVRALGGEGASAAVRALARAGLAATLPYRPSATAPLERVWVLTALGAKAAAARASHAAGEGGESDPAVRRAARTARADALSALFLTHNLRLSDLYVALRIHMGQAFAWRTQDEARIAFRSLASADGRGLVVPDALVAPPGLPYGADPLVLGACAIELDRSTMGRSAIDRKLLRYRELVADRGPFGPLVFVADDPRRRDRLADWLRRAGVEGRTADAATAVELVAAFLRGRTGDIDS